MTTITAVSDEPPPQELFKLARDLERWRASTQRGQRIPGHLWEAAARLARTYGVSRISAVLKLSYYDLKRRAQSERAVSTQRQAPPTFIELSAPSGSAGAGPSSPDLIEVVHACGARLMLRLPRTRPEDLLALLRSFLEHRP